MKRLVYIFIPILAVLLMSHNTFAVGNKFTPYTCYHTTGGQTYCQNYELTTGDTVDIISIAKSNNLPDLQSVNISNQFLWALNVRSYGTNNQQFAINLGNGWPDNAEIDNIWQDCQVVNGYTSCNILVSGNILQNNWNIQLAGQVTTFGAQYTIDSLYFSASFDHSYNIYSTLGNLYNYLRNNPTPSAQDIADAVNQPTQDAVDNIDNQSTSDIDAGDSSSATNLLGNIQGIFNQINSIPVGNTCSIAADFGNLNLGNINFCTGKDKLPFPVTFGAYCFELIFVIGTSIILIKQVLSILDWSRR